MLGENNQHPSSIRCRGSNSRPLDREPSALTTRPRLLAVYIEIRRIALTAHETFREQNVFHFLLKLGTDKKLHLTQLGNNFGARRKRRKKYLAFKMDRTKK